MKKLFVLLGFLSLPLAASETDRLSLMTEMQYTDEQQCHVRMTADEAPRSIVHLLLASHGIEGIDQKKVMAALDTAALRGCDFNELEKGLSPLHVAMLYNDAAMVRYLLNHGAKVSVTVNRPDSRAHGMNAAAFMDFLLLLDVERAHALDRGAVQELIVQANHQ